MAIKPSLRDRTCEEADIKQGKRTAPRLWQPVSMQPAAAAVRIVEAGVRAARYRLRAVQDRWIPGVEQALAEVTFAIEELELADASRLRLASQAALGFSAVIARVRPVV